MGVNVDGAPGSTGDDQFSESDLCHAGHHPMTIPYSSAKRIPVGHTLIELMIAILVGMFLKSSAFTVLAAFEGNKRSTTFNDATVWQLWSSYPRQIDPLFCERHCTRRPQECMGCGLNYVPTDGTSNGSTVDSVRANVAGSFHVNFEYSWCNCFTSCARDRVPGHHGFRGHRIVESCDVGCTHGIARGAGYAEAPISITGTSGPTVDSTVGFHEQ